MKLFLLSMLALSAMSMSAREVSTKTDSLSKLSTAMEEHLMMPLKPIYLTNTIENVGWSGNWFIEAKGGATAFIGSPVGCGDLFDRISPTLQVGLGKWFTPSIGGRVEFQGLQFKNANLENMKYQYVHADFLYNVTGMLGMNEQGLSRWDLVPFVGVGMIHNSDWKNGCQCEGVMSNSHPFAFSYGVQVGYRLTNRLHLLAEISGMTTAKSFDAIGTSAKFGDNMLNISAGLSVTIGKTGWKRVIDARPYINQNNYLMDQLAILRNSNSRLDSIKGNASCDKNNYSGLNSLRYRMSLTGEDGTASAADSVSAMGGDGMNNSTIGIGTPVYFYFKIGTTQLVDNTQMSNLDEIAKLAKEHDCTIKVTGAADSATGTSKVNRNLSKARAKFIARELMKHGISKEQIKATSLGGINEFTPTEANRNTCVIVLQ